MKATIRNKDMQVGVKSQWKIPERLYGDDSPGHGLRVPHTGRVKGFQILPSTTAQTGKELAIIKEISAENFRDAESEMAMRNGFQDFFTEPLAEFNHPLLMT